MGTSKNATNKKAAPKKPDSFDISHKQDVPVAPKPLIDPPKEATDPSELIKHA